MHGERSVAPLVLSHDADYGWLTAAEYGIAVDGIASDLWRPVSDQFAYLLRDTDGPEIGFQLIDPKNFDPSEFEVLFEGPRFDVPVLGLRAASAGEIILASDTFHEGESTLNRILFDQAVEAKGEEAVTEWRYCLQAGDQMAHFGLGYTLYELGQHRTAYRHLRFYTEIVPAQPWAWVWRGRAAQAIGELDDAANCYRRAIALEEEDEEAEGTTAGELLGELTVATGGVGSEGWVPDTPFDSADYLRDLELPVAGDSAVRPVAVFLAGGPLAGKSSMVAQMLEDGSPFLPPDAVRIDPKALREELPDFVTGFSERDPRVTDLVRSETIHISRTLTVRAVTESHNLLVDGLGASEPGAFLSVLKNFQHAGYEVRVLLVDCATEEALERNDRLAKSSGFRIDPTTIRTLHRDVSRRMHEWSTLDGLTVSMCSTSKER